MCAGRVPERQQAPFRLLLQLLEAAILTEHSEAAATELRTCVAVTRKALEVSVATQDIVDKKGENNETSQGGQGGAAPGAIRRLLSVLEQVCAVFVDVCCVLWGCC